MYSRKMTVPSGVPGLCLCVLGCVFACAAEPQSVERMPKYIFVLIGDGMGFNHIRAADYYQCGTSPCHAYEDFPIRLAVSTFPDGGSYDPNLAWSDWDYVKHQATDSAASGTALATGVKTYDTAIGVDANGDAVANVIERAEELGMATGVVTSVPFSHATPAAFVVHNTDRDNYYQIAEQMISLSSVDCIMGCGHPLYDKDGIYRRPPQLSYVSEEPWMRLLRRTPCADANGDGIPDAWTFIQTRQEFQNLMTGPAPSRVMGVAQVYETLQERRSGDSLLLPYAAPLTATVPTLEEMARAAINVLDEDPDGFFVMIEGGAVDWAGHDNHSGRLIEEMADFNRTIQAVLAWVEEHSNWDESVVIITADHETGYLTGPGSSGHAVKNPVWTELVSSGPNNVPGMQWNYISHTNSLVPLFARGRGTELFAGTIDGHDPVRGDYIDNTDIGRILFALLNRPPVADAGDDQTAYAWIDGIARVSLDGNDSYDEDGDPLTYRWSWTIDGNDFQAIGVDVNVQLPAGRHTLELWVNDGISDSVPDEVTVTVVPAAESYLLMAPKCLNRQAHNSKVVAMLTLPAGIRRADIDGNEPMILYPQEVSPAVKYIFESRRCSRVHTTIIAFFDKSDVIGDLPSGRTEMDLVGRLKTGQYFYGDDTIFIYGWPPGKPWR